MFDYIIIGGGTAGQSHSPKSSQAADEREGCFLVSRLSSSLPENKILLIGAGKESDERIKPSMGVALGEHADLQWDLMSVPQKTLNGVTVSSHFASFSHLLISISFSS